MPAKKPTQMLTGTVKRLKLEALAEDNNRASGDKQALRDTAEWYLFCNAHMVVKVHHEGIPEKVWGVIDPEPSTSLRYHQRWGDGQAARLATHLPDWVGATAPQAGGVLSIVTLDDEIGQGLAAARNTRMRLVSFMYRKQRLFAQKAYVDLVLKFWPTAEAFYGPTIEIANVFDGKVESRICPLLFLLLNPEDKVQAEGEVVGAVMPYRVL